LSVRYVPHQRSGATVRILVRQEALVLAEISAEVLLRVERVAVGTDAAVGLVLVDALSSVPTEPWHLAFIDVFTLLGTIVEFVASGTLARDSRFLVVHTGAMFTIIW